MKKHIKYFFLLVALPLVSIAEGNADILFKEANALYAKAKYKDAIQTYQAVLSGGYQSASVFFNLGNAYYKQGDLPSALLYYEKAHKLVANDEDINFNIRLTTLKTADKIDPIPQLFLTKWWNDLTLKCSVGTWAVSTILFFLSGFGLLILYLFAQTVNRKQTFFFGGIVAVLSGLITMFFASSQLNYFSSHHQAIVFSKVVSVKSEPMANSKNLFVIHEGTKIDVLENSDSWARVRLANGNEGWMLAGDFKKI
jgi:tetratricopeptide (TPR) repeat protein